MYQTIYSKIIGDWGYQGKTDNNTFYGEDQLKVARNLEKYANLHDTKFIINVGDSFYKSNKDDYQGVESVEDEKWNTTWLNIYKDKLSEIPWYSVAGNHDWYNDINAQIEYSLTKNSRFFLPSLFYARLTTFGQKKTEIAWIHIDTNLFFYEYKNINENVQFAKNFQYFGWDVNKENKIEEKLRWIEEKLIEFQDVKWIFIAGHHPLIGDCSETYYMPELLSLLQKYRVTAYLSGHAHVLELKLPDSNSSNKLARFISGAASRTSSGCPGEKDWGMPEGTFGFLHFTIKDDDDYLNFQFVDSTTVNDKVVYENKLKSIPIWYPK
ncbi:3939_t:CDS:2 [Entrophospora sp. SA101]|nr:3939_t:CDS:2 [Entrophospora sp. SA101]